MFNKHGRRSNLLLIPGNLNHPLEGSIHEICLASRKEYQQKLCIFSANVKLLKLLMLQSQMEIILETH